MLNYRKTSWKLFNAIEVSSMTGDCPESWIEDWISMGYDCIHFIGNGCDDWTLMDQRTIIEEPHWKIVDAFNDYDKR